MSKSLKVISYIIIQFLVLYAGDVFSKNYDTLVIQDDFSQVHIGRYVRYLSDSTNQMELKDFLETSAPTVATLKANFKNEINFGYGQNQYWFQSHIYNSSEQPKKLFFNIAYPNLDHFVVYQRQKIYGEDSIVQIAEMGDRFSYGNKIIPHRNYIVPITLAPNATTDYFFQIKKQWEPINFPIILTDEYNLVRRTNNDNLFLGAFGGVFIMFVLTLVAVYLYTRNIFFLLYIALSVLTFLDVLSDTGIGLQYVWSPWAFIQNILPYFIIFGTIIIHIVFIRLFFQTAIYLVRFNSFLLAMLWMVILTVILLTAFALIFPSSNLPFQIGYNIVNGIYLSYGLVVLALCVVTLIQVRRIEIIWITIVVFIQFVKWSFLIVARGNAFPIIFKNFSIYDLNFFNSHLATPHIAFLFILLELLIVTIILSANFYTFLKNNSSGKYKLMMMTRNTINAYIEGQEDERVKLTDKINEGIGEDLKMLGWQINATIKKFEQPVVKAKLLSISEEVQKVRESIKRITTNFVPSEYDNKNLYDAIKSVFSILEQNGIQVKYQLATPSPRINNFSKVNVIRILQELTSNINKHSEAQQVVVKVFYHQDLVISIHDDGKGFDTSDYQGGIGLMNVKSRVRGMNGEVEVESDQVKGTSFIIKIPMQNLQ